MNCAKTAEIDGATLLFCDLPPDHTGRLHFDSEDSIWWVHDGESGEGV